MKKKILSILLSITMVGTLMAGTVGCGKKDTEDSTTEAVKTEETTASNMEVGPDGKIRSFLTGEWVDAEVAMKRPIAVMVENTTMSIPSSNTSNASVYYEAPEEGGITRIMALFDDIEGLGTIGNVRSTRPYFVYTAIAFDAILAHCGGSIETYQDLLDKGKVDNLDERVGATGFFRDNSRSAPQNLYADSEGLEKCIQDKGYDRNYSDLYTGYFQFNKDDEHEIELSGGMDAAVVTVYQSDCKPWFVYNEKDGLYYRYEFGKEQMDQVTNTQLAVKNVIIQECTVETYYDEENHDRVDVGINKGGYGKYITNGKAIDISWTSDGFGKGTHYFDMDGNEITLNQGKTWINIMDVNYATNNMIYSTVEQYEASKDGSTTEKYETIDEE